MKEKRRRSILKTISWRVLATLDTIIIVFILTGNFTLSLSAGGIEVFTKLTLYYLHERGWQKIKWGQSSTEQQ